MQNDMPDSPEALLQRMIAFNTVNARPDGAPGREGPLADYLEQRAAAAGLRTGRLGVENEPPNLMVSHQVDADAPWVMMVSHLDTVAVDAMTIEPFAGETRDGRIYGRGACDTKGSGAAMLWSLVQYAAQPDRPNNVAVLYSVSEEIGMTGMVSFVANDLPDLGWAPAGVVVGEPTDLCPVTAHNGVVRWRIHTRGVGAHSSEPSAGRSAISMMVEVVRAIESRYIANLDASHPMTGRAQCSINLIRGGSQINVIPSHCEIHLDRRTVPGEDADRVLAEVETVLDDLRRADPNLVVEQESPYIVGPLDPTTNEQWVRHVCGVLDRLGLPATPVGAKYGTEASALSRAGVSSLVLGPGSAAQAHTNDEWLSLEQLRLGCEVYLAIMKTPAS